MTLQIIIQEIKAFGYVLPQSKQKSQAQNQEQITQKRRFRISFGTNLYISKQYGVFKSKSQLFFYEPYSFMYDNHSNLLQIQIFKQHQFGNNQDFGLQLNASIDLSDFTVMKGDHIQTDLTDLYGQSVGSLMVVVDVFRKGAKFYEKVVSSVLVEEVRQGVQRVRKQMKVTAAGKNIKNLMVNQQLSNQLMTINSMHIIPDTQDVQIFNKQCFIMIKYGPNIKVFSKVIKSQVKDSVSFMDYLQFIKTQEYKFEFFFLFIDQFNNITCRARGQIKYIVFDQTINSHSIILFDKKSNKYGVLMVKFIEKQAQNGAQVIQYKTDKKLKQYDTQINQSLDIYNRYKFEAKYQNHLLSEKMAELQLQKQIEEEEKSRPMNEQQKKKQQEHKKFIEFLQKQVLRIERQLMKKEQKNKNQQRKQKYLPNFMSKGQTKNTRNSRINNSLSVSQSSSEFREGKIKLPKV